MKLVFKDKQEVEDTNFIFFYPFSSLDTPSSLTIVITFSNNGLRDSELGCENVVKLLKDRLKTVSTIFVITHSESLKPLFEKQK
jgi:hypothetical protein